MLKRNVLLFVILFQVFTLGAWANDDSDDQSELTAQQQAVRVEFETIKFLSQERKVREERLKAYLNYLAVRLPDQKNIAFRKTFKTYVDSKPNTNLLAEYDDSDLNKLLDRTFYDRAVQPQIVVVPILQDVERGYLLTMSNVHAKKDPRVNTFSLSLAFNPNRNVQSIPAIAKNMIKGLEAAVNYYGFEFTRILMDSPAPEISKNLYKFQDANNETIFYGIKLHLLFANLMEKEVFLQRFKEILITYMQTVELIQEGYTEITPALLTPRSCQGYLLQPSI